MTPAGQAVPDKDAADQAVQFMVSGDRNVINYRIELDAPSDLLSLTVPRGTRVERRAV
ncbi:hypothetical protein AB0F91_44835 [Amycolatopsis sp. NPDC023774]|uniref:hypothetical protein n=1 Tax=Amycolatopsis sp. NPDC023774 TaxID=3155015 RepID=UPI00340A8CF9